MVEPFLGAIIAFGGCVLFCIAMAFALHRNHECCDCCYSRKLTAKVAKKVSETRISVKVAESKPLEVSTIEIP